MLTVVTYLVLALVAYRIGRFISLDDLISEPRDKFVEWLLSPAELPLWREKVVTLISCPWCITIWTGAGVSLFHDLLLAEWSGWWWPINALVVATLAVIIWSLIDSRE